MDLEATSKGQFKLAIFNLFDDLLIRHGESIHLRWSNIIGPLESLHSQGWNIIIYSGSDRKAETVDLDEYLGPVKYLLICGADSSDSFGGPGEILLKTLPIISGRIHPQSFCLDGTKITGIKCVDPYTIFKEKLIPSI